MNTINLKKEIVRRIEAEENTSILEAVRNLLVHKDNEPVIMKKLTARALKAEQDIKEGKVHTKSEFQKKLKDYVKKKWK